VTGAARSLPWRGFARPVTSVGLVGAIGLAIACGHAGTTVPANTAREGVSIALYDRHDGDAHGVIDDRRWIEVAGDSLVLEHVDPGAALSSLVIEPCRRALALVPASAIGSRPRRRPTVSSRQRTAGRYSPGVALRGARRRGRYLVRLFYAPPALAIAPSTTSR
jgi:hypothetical protein